MNNEITTNSSAVVLFQHNLRLHDNPALVAAAKHETLICLYCYDDWQFDTSFGLNQCGPFRAEFLWQSLQDLQATLQTLGQTLYIVKGELCSVITQIQQQLPELYLYAQTPSDSREYQQLNRLSAQIPCQLLPGSTLLAPSDLPFALAALPKVFTHFRNKVEKHWPHISPLSNPLILPPKPHMTLNTLQSSPLPEAYSSEVRPAINFIGGESQAKKRLEHYIWQTKAICSYKQTRNQLLGEDYSSKFSPWLATGCLSAKYIYTQVKLFEDQHGANDSTYWLIFELLWRDYFAFTAQRDETNLGVAETSAQPLQPHQQQTFNSWCIGRTGNRFIDANMRELLLTGFMSNRGRQNVASYLINELNIDWRFGAAWFEQQLIDFDFASNVGNWQYIAGIKSPNGPRHFNVVSQAERYDAQGEFCRHWLD